MKTAVQVLCFGIALILGTAALAGEAAPPAAPEHDNRALFALWGKITGPSEGEPHPIGTFSAGCIAGAKKLPIDGTGYSVMRVSRARYYGYPDLINFIETLGRQMHAQKLNRLLVGDMGRARGGPMQTGHASHQIGLDVDLWFRMSKKIPTSAERESWSAESFVKNNKTLTKHWGEPYRKLVSLAAESPYVNRIFVHPAIKRDLCEKFPDAPWLYKMRPWWSHQDHLHVRLNCPAGDADCKGQEALDPKHPQCGKELDWWFTADAKAEGEKKEAAYKGRQFPELPPQCADMVKGLE
jgi:penicillin-insensitive murein endopeptidase